MAKVNLFPDFRGFLESLNSAGAKYLLLGGYAVIHYGYRRATDDLDVWIAVDPDNAVRVAKVLREFFGFAACKVKPAMFLKPGKMFVIGREPVRIDIVTSPSGRAKDLADLEVLQSIVPTGGPKRQTRRIANDRPQTGGRKKPPKKP